MNDRTGQVAIVTGASLGVGLATISALAARDIDVVVMVFVIENRYN